MPILDTIEEIRRPHAPLVNVQIFGAIFGFGCGRGAETVGADAAPGIDGRIFADAAPLPDGAPLRACEREASAGPVDLGDGTITASTVEIAAGGPVQVVVVTVDLEHPYPRDLTLELVSPAGTVVRLATRRGRGDGYRNSQFRDDAPSSIAEAEGGLHGAYRPEEPLARLAGEAAAGGWTLRVTDGAAGDAGRLAGWSLRVDACAPPACVTFTHRAARAAPPGASLPTSSLFPVTDPTAIVTARVGLSVVYMFDEDLGLRLWSPRGSVVELSSANGGLGSDYEATVFDDTAPVSVREGIAPFTGRYRPEARLGALAGEPAAGTWIVEVGRAVGPWMSQGEELRVAAATLELDVCDLACPDGTTPLAVSAEGAGFAVLATGTVAAAALRATPLAPATVTLTAPSRMALTWLLTEPTRLDASALAGGSAEGAWTLAATDGPVADAVLELCVRP